MWIFPVTFAGMVTGGQPPASIEKPAMAMTMLGITTPGAMTVKNRLESLGYDVVPFHAADPGGTAIEALIGLGKFAAVVDVSTHELINHLYGGLIGVPDRLGEPKWRLYPRERGGLFADQTRL